MKQFTGSHLVSTALDRDGGRCLRCGKRARRVWTKVDRTSYDRVQRKRIPVDPRLDDLVTLCVECANRCIDEEAMALKKKAAGAAASIRRSKNQLPAFSEDWFKTCDPRDKFAGDLTTKRR